MQEVIFWQSVTKFEKVNEINAEGQLVTSRAVVELVPCPAVIVGASEQRCAICKEPEAGHARRGRRHIFEPMADPGKTLDVTYPNGQVERRYNVMLGKSENCWTLDVNGSLPVVHGKLNINLSSLLIKE